MRNLFNTSVLYCKPWIVFAGMQARVKKAGEIIAKLKRMCGMLKGNEFRISALCLFFPRSSVLDMTFPCAEQHKKALADEEHDDARTMQQSGTLEMFSPPLVSA